MKKALIAIVMVLFASSLCLAEEKMVTPAPETAKAAPAPAVAQKPAVKTEKKATKGVKPKAKKAKSVPATAAVKK